ncbi:hypothetical protein [Sphingomonas sp. TREG-RG-20F-R18-01]|uniref:hypothetical protein n=1 Tax=Sphingomonas sp. TREG-RG-20F-R18-01 TaxID=2914982 RepID=UPI001F5785DD|nr:hypothetical protein [Sphingomonas sp. TREG-RG-20F-R18-01]
MSKYFAVHEIHDENGIHLGEVFEPAAADVQGFLATGAVRAPTDQELAFHDMIHGSSKAAAEAQKVAEKDAAQVQAEAAAAAEAQRVADEAAAAEAQRVADEAAAAEAQRVADEAAATPQTAAEKRAAKKAEDEAAKASAGADLVG